MYVPPLPDVLPLCVLLLCVLPALPGL